MKKLAFALLPLWAWVPFQGYAQEELQLTSKDSIVDSFWMAGLGYTFVDDSGDMFKDFTTVNGQWNAIAIPSRVSIGKYFKSGIGLEAIGSYTKYNNGNVVDGETINEDIDYYGIDSRISYDLRKLLGDMGWFDPYLGAGLGYTDANHVGRGTYNAVVGFRTWFSDRLGLDISSSGKWAMGSEATNHIQHAAGLVYRFGIKKALSKKGEEKLALIQEAEKERQREQDSIAAAEKAKRDAELAERLAKEQEAAALAAAEKEARAKLKKDIEDRLKDAGEIHFNFNSSYINATSKPTLDKIYTLMVEQPALELRISSHTDSRGSDKYNMWLSQRRADRTKEYLIGKGVDGARLSTKAFGEEGLLNECDDNVYCTEAKHRINRRSEFEIIAY